MLDKRTRSILLEVHTWTGLVVGLVLYVMLLFGGFALYREEFGRWEDRAQHVAPVRGEGHDEAAQALLERELPAGVRRYFVHRPGDGAPLHIAWHPVPGQEDWRSLAIDPVRGTVTPSDTHASAFIFQLHFLWHEAAPALYYVAGLIAVGFLLAIVTGVFFHLKHLGPQLGRFRPEQTTRVATTDLHKVLGAFGIPFQLVFAITGAFIVLGSVIVKAYMGPVLGGNEALAEQMLWGEAVPLAHPIPVEGDLDDRIALAERHVPGLEVFRFSVSDRGQPGETLEIEGKEPTHLGGQAVVEFEGPGRPLTAVWMASNQGLGPAITRWIFGLHYARFGGSVLRFVYLILALAAAATAISGNLIWLARKGAMTHRYLAACTEATGTGALVASAAILLASRFLPTSMADRAHVEELIFAGAFLLVMLDSMIARDAHRAFVRHLVLIGLGFVAMPISTAMIGSRGLFSLLVGRGSDGGSVVGVDSAALVLGLASVALAVRLRARSSAPLPEPASSSESSHA